jgi:hypothetical protein
MRTHGPFLSIKCLNKGPWKEGPGPEKIMQRQFSMKKSEITACSGKNGNRAFFLQDFIWEKGILDKNKCPFSKSQPLSLF